MRSLLQQIGFGRERKGANDQFGTLFVHFRRIVTTNNQILEKIADLERVLGGEYIYDRTFLQNAVSEIINLGRSVIYHLNAMSDERYSRLYDLFTVTADYLSDILAGGLGPYGPFPVLEWNVLHRDLGHLAGNKGACLGEISNGLELPCPEGFVVSTTGYRRFMEANDLFNRIREVMGETDDPAVRAAGISDLFAQAKMPSDLADAIKKAIKKLRRGPNPPSLFAVRSSGVDEDSHRSFAGQFLSLLNVAAKDIPNACVQVMASRFSEEIFRYLGNDLSPEESPIAVVVQPMVHAEASGVLYTRDPNHPDAGTMVLSTVSGLGEELASGRDAGDRFVFERNHPFTLVESYITPSQNDAGLSQAMSPGQTGMRRGSGIIGLDVIRKMAEYGLLLEKRFEYPQDIEWCRDGDDRLWILQSRPLRLRQVNRDAASVDKLMEELSALPVLMSGKGHICQLGIAGGVVVHVDEDTEVESFPAGAVAVSHFASPKLAEIVQRASAIITDIGSPTSHLATITREYRTPALFGTGDATSVLKEGMHVMVDVEAKTIYQGHVELPPGLPESEGFAAPPDYKEASLLRRLLRLIAPLNLVDPTSPDFKMENCQTIHDFIRFCHEQAVAELIRFHTSGRVISHGLAPVLKTGLPLKIRVVDIGGGVRASEEEGRKVKEVEIDDVLSVPFQAILRGLLKKEFWSQDVASFGIRDMLSGITQPMSMLSNISTYSGENLAILAQDYCDVNLRMGYHFNIIDCYLCDEADDNYIYFRFAGGLAEPGKRRRRAEMISRILSGLYFKSEIKGDLVLGKVKMLERKHMERILEHLGELVAFTRQLDVKMADDKAIEKFFNDFLGRIRENMSSEGA